MLYHTPGSSAAVPQSPVTPNSRTSSAPQFVHSFSFPPGPRFPEFPSSPDMTLLAWVTCGHPCGAAPPPTTTSSCARLFRCSRIWFAEGRLCTRGCDCSATCTRLLGFEATCTELGIVALQGDPCRASVQESLYYLGPHHPGFKRKQTCLRAVVQLPLVTLEAQTPRADPPVDVCMYLYIFLCVLCVCCHPTYSERQACGRTRRGHTGGWSHMISHPPSFCGDVCLNFSREKDSAVPFPHRP